MPRTSEVTIPFSWMRFWRNRIAQSEEPAGRIEAVRVRTFFATVFGLSFWLSTSSKRIASGRNSSSLIPRLAVSRPSASTLKPFDVRSWFRRQPLELPYLPTLRSTPIPSKRVAMLWTWRSAWSCVSETIRTNRRASLQPM